jgi:hypothetical protein
VVDPASTVYLELAALPLSVSLHPEGKVLEEPELLLKVLKFCVWGLVVDEMLICAFDKLANNSTNKKRQLLIIQSIYK